MDQSTVTLVTIPASEQRHLLEISHLFLCLSLVVQGAAQPKVRDQALERLKNLQPFLAQFVVPTHPAEAALIKETLSFFEEKKQLSLVGAAKVIRGCTLSAHFFQGLLAQTWRLAAAEGVPASSQKTLH